MISLLQSLRKETNMNNSKDLTGDEEGFEDDGVAEEGEKEEINLEHQSRRRGKDRDWTLLESFESFAGYKTSHYYTSELSKMSMRKRRSTKYAEIHIIVNSVQILFVKSVKIHIKR